MRVALVRNWWSLVLRGVLGVLLGVLTFAWPGITLASLVLLFGAYALIDGIVSIAGAVRAAQAHERWVVLVIEGGVVITGNRPERATRTASFASRNCASAATTFWFEMLTCSSSALS